MQTRKLASQPSKPSLNNALHKMGFTASKARHTQWYYWLPQQCPLAQLARQGKIAPASPLARYYIQAQQAPIAKPYNTLKSYRASALAYKLAYTPHWFSKGA